VEWGGWWHVLGLPSAMGFSGEDKPVAADAIGPGCSLGVHACAKSL